MLVRVPPIRSDSAPKDAGGLTSALVMDHVFTFLETCCAGAVISSATVSVQTQSATLSAGRRLLAADSDSTDRQGVQYVTRGNHLIATRPGKALGEELTEVSHPVQCPA